MKYYSNELVLAIYDNFAQREITACEITQNETAINTRTEGSRQSGWCLSEPRLYMYCVLMARWPEKEAHCNREISVPSRMGKVTQVLSYCALYSVKSTPANLNFKSGQLDFFVFENKWYICPRASYSYSSHNVLVGSYSPHTNEQRRTRTVASRTGPNAVGGVIYCARYVQRAERLLTCRALQRERVADRWCVAVRQWRVCHCRGCRLAVIGNRCEHRNKYWWIGSNLLYILFSQSKHISVQ